MSESIRRNAPVFLDVDSLRKIIDPIDEYDIKIHQAARWYAQNGFLIIPFRPGDKDGKYSGYPKGLSQHHATKDLDKIDEWWHPINGRFSGASIAMAHGGQSGFCALDLDRKGTVDGIRNLADLQMAYGNYDDGEGEDLQTLMATTPSGGRHLIFRYHPEIISNSEVNIAGIDTRGGLKKDPKKNGGITFVEPSKKPRKDGTYRWDNNITEIKDMPQWLVDVLNGRTPEIKGGIQLQESYVESAPGDHGDGRDRNIYMDLMRFAGIGYSEDQLWALMPKILERMDPPDEDMVRRKIESVIQSDAYKSAQEDNTTKRQLSSLPLIVDKKDNIVKCVENLDIILRSSLFEHEYGHIEYDDFTQSFIINKKPMASRVDWSIGIQTWIAKKFRLDFPKTDIRDRVEYIAYENPHTNIARDYMLRCPKPTGPQKEDWHSSGRKGPGPAFKRLCYEVLDLGNKNLHPGFSEEKSRAYIAFLWFWMQGVAARACVPGCKMEIVLNIFGGQGIGKSLFLRELCPDPKWFTDSIQDSIVGGGQNNRDELMKLHAKIIVEMPELNPIKRGGKSSDDKFKQFISSQVDNMRLPYAHDSIDYPRSCALAGTSNNRDVYRDSTGARRFLSIDHGDIPIKVGDQDEGVMDEIRDLVWGEIIASFNDGDLDKKDKLLVAVPPPLRDMQNRINNNHRFEEIGVLDISEWLADKTRVTWQEIITYAKTLPGLGDSKESTIMTTIRKELSNNKYFEFKRGATRYDEYGNKTRQNCWINNSLEVEKNMALGGEIPPHWKKADQEEPEY